MTAPRRLNVEAELFPLGPKHSGMHGRAKLGFARYRRGSRCSKGLSPLAPKLELGCEGAW